MTAFLLRGVGSKFFSKGGWVPLAGEGSGLRAVQPDLHLLGWVRGRSALTVLSSFVAQSHSP